LTVVYATRLPSDATVEALETFDSGGAMSSEVTLERELFRLSMPTWDGQIIDVFEFADGKPFEGAPEFKDSADALIEISCKFEGRACCG
jgi:hypothetical protein